MVVNKPVSRAPRPPQTYGSRPGPPHQYAPEPHGPRPGPYNQGPPRPGPPRPGPPHQYAPQQFRPRQAPPRQCAPNQFAPRGQYAPLSQYGPWPSAPRSNGPSAGRPRTGAGPQVDRAPSGTPCFQTGAAGAGAGTGVERRGMLSAGALDRMLADCCPQTQLLSAADLPQCVSVLVCHLEQEGEGEGEAGGEGRGMAILWGQLCCSHFVSPQPAISTHTHPTSSLRIEEFHDYGFCVYSYLKIYPAEKKLKIAFFIFFPNPALRLRVDIYTYAPCY